MARDLPNASLLEGVRFTRLVALPNVLQGLFRRRPGAVALATRLNVDRRAVGVVDRLRRRHGAGPVWVRILANKALLLLSVDDVHRVLEGSPDPFAADPEPKRRGMSHFQPDALTLSRGELWRSRRRFTEAVLDSGKPMHRNADRFRTVIEEETSTLLREAERAEGHLEWERFHRAGWRITRRIILGDGAADDEELTKLLAELMAEANRLPKKRSERFEPFMARLGEHVSKAEPGSLVALFDEAPSDAETKVVGQVPHWLFALGDTLPANSFRALALIVTHPRQGARVDEELTAAEREGRLGTASGVAGLSYLDACLEEAMRLWPTTAILSRETLTETRWDGAPVPAGTQVLISNIFNHRDPASHEFADRFAPEAWLEAGARDDWSFNQFSHGPQGCPGTGIALFVGKGVLAGLMTQRRIRLMEPELDPVRPLPHMLDFHRLRFAVEPRS